MIDFQQLSKRLAQCSEQEISFGEFEDWFVSNSWNVHQTRNRKLVDAVFHIEELLSAELDNRLDHATLLRLFGGLSAEYQSKHEAANLATPYVRSTDRFCVRFALEGSPGKAQPLNRNSIEDFGFSKAILKCVPGVSPIAGRSSSLDVRFGEAA